LIGGRRSKVPSQKLTIDIFIYGLLASKSLGKFNRAPHEYGRALDRTASTPVIAALLLIAGIDPCGFELLWIVGALVGRASRQN
jgi:hypothetical protein